MRAASAQGHCCHAFECRDVAGGVAYLYDLLMLLGCLQPRQHLEHLFAVTALSRHVLHQSACNICSQARLTLCKVMGDGQGRCPLTMHVLRSNCLQPVWRRLHKCKRRLALPLGIQMHQGFTCKSRVLHCLVLTSQLMLYLAVMSM